MHTKLAQSIVLLSAALFQSALAIEPAWRLQFLTLVNDARQQSGIQPVCLNADLNSAANAQSLFLEGRKLSHTGPDNDTPGDRATVAGFDWTKIAENAAPAGTVQIMFNLLMDDPPHQVNIMNPAYKFMGIGSTTNGDQHTGAYVQMFGASDSQQCIDLGSVQSVPAALSALNANIALKPTTTRLSTLVNPWVGPHTSSLAIISSSSTSSTPCTQTPTPKVLPPMKCRARPSTSSSVIPTPTNLTPMKCRARPVGYGSTVVTSAGSTDSTSSKEFATGSCSKDRPCAQGLCCSQWGYCGTGLFYCSASTSFNSTSIASSSVTATSASTIMQTTTTSQTAAPTLTLLPIV